MVALNVDLAQRESSNKELADPGQPTLNLGLPGFFYFKYFIWLQQVLVAASIFIAACGIQLPN